MHIQLKLSCNFDIFKYLYKHHLTFVHVIFRHPAINPVWSSWHTTESRRPQTDVSEVSDDALTVAVVGILRPVDVPELVDHQKPLRATVEASDPNVPSFHVVVVPGVALVFGAVGHSGPVSIAHANTADQQHQPQFTRKLRQFPSQRPFVHYTAFLKEFVIHILKAKLKLWEIRSDSFPVQSSDAGVTSDLQQQQNLLRAGGDSSVFVSAVNDTNQQTDASHTVHSWWRYRRQVSSTVISIIHKHVSISGWPIQYLERVYIQYI